MRVLIILTTGFLLSACAGTPRPLTTDLSSGMTRQEVMEKLGQPVSATIKDGEQQLIFQVHDHAYGRDKNYYEIGFRDGRLISVLPLPDDQQEMGPIDKALRLKVIR